jgi:hypothetical protein
MGTEYSLINHSNATYYELGKGDWYLLNGEKWIFYDPEFFVEFFNAEHEETYKEPFKEETLQYYKLIAEGLKKFVGDTKEESLVVVGDVDGDSHIFIRYLKYECLGTRYELRDLVKNKENIDYENNRTKEWGKYSPDKNDIEQMKTGGWNFKNVNFYGDHDDKSTN